MTSPTGLYLPDNLVQDQSAFPAHPSTTGAVFGASIRQALETGITGDLIMRANDTLTQVFQPGQFLTFEQWKNDPDLYRPGLASEFQGGVSQNVAALKAEKYDAVQRNEAVLNNASHSLGTTFTEISGSLVGGALDPVNWLGAGAVLRAGEIIGSKAPMIRALLESESLGVRLGAGAVRGAAEGAAISTPNALAEADIEQQLGGDPTALQVLANIGIGTGLGGLIRVGMAIKKPITAAADRMAKQTAVNQLANGKAVDVGDIVQDGYHQARLNEAPLSPEFLRQNEQALEESLAQIDQQIQGHEATLERLERTEASHRRLLGLENVERAGVESAPQIAQRVLAIEAKAPLERTAEDRLYLNRVPQTEEVQNMLAIARTPPFRQSAEQRVSLRSFLEGQEAEQLSQRLADHRAELEQIQTQLQKPRLAKYRRAQLQARENELNENLKAGEKRLHDLQTHGQPAAAVRQAQQALMDARIKRAHLEKLQQAHQVLTQLEASRGTPVTRSQLSTSARRVQSYTGDAVYNPAEIEQLEAYYQALPEEAAAEMDALEEQINHLRVEDLLDADDQALLEDVEALDREFPRLETAIQNLADCLKGGV